MAGFENIGAFDSADPIERWQAHQAAKGRSHYTAEQADIMRKRAREIASGVAGDERRGGTTPNASEEILGPVSELP